MLDGKISISRMNSNSKSIHNNIMIEVINENNQVVNIRMTPEEFALALTGISGRECAYYVFENKEGEINEQ